MTFTHMAEPPPPDFSPLALVQAALDRYWLGLLVLGLCILVSLRKSQRGEARSDAWLGVPILLQSWLAIVVVFEQIDQFASQLHIFHSFFVAQLALLLHVTPIAAVLIYTRWRRRHATGTRSYWWTGALVAAYAVILDHALILFVLSDLSALIGDGG